ncbi:aromatic acid exporter family protein [Micromonospora sp. NPDC000089]|uniref:FUSC family protein n=1 Tax=unclassified Micromonospora TaxID=2617518 RepID=UPI0036834B12
MTARPRRWATLRRSSLDIAGPGVFRHRLRMAAPLIAQCAVLAGLAWWISQTLFGHQRPIFAATAALVCLTAGLGGRGRQAVDLLVGVGTGVLVGEGVRALHAGNDFWLIALAIAVAMATVALVDPRPLTYIQAGGAVLIVVVVGASSSPTDYLLDAATGGVIGLLGSQVLFTPDPVRLVEAPAREILADAADALRTAADALARGSAAGARAACADAREAHARLGELSAARAAAHKETFRTVRGRRRAARLRQADQPLDDMDVLVAAVLLLCVDARSELANRSELADRSAHIGGGASADGTRARPAAPDTGHESLPRRLTALADGLMALAAHPVPAMHPTPPTAPGATIAPAGPGVTTTGAPAASRHADVHLRDAQLALHRLGTPPP